MTILQMMPLAPGGEAELHRRHHDVCRFDQLADQDAWIDRHGGSVRVVITSGHGGLSGDLMHRLPALGLVAIAGVGFENVDLVQARAHGIGVTNTPDVLTEDVADMAIGLMLGVMRRIPAADRHVREGIWTRGDMPLADRASGQRYGILGLGRIGKAIARRLEGFEGTISYSSRAIKSGLPYRFHANAVDLAGDCDVLFVTAPSTPENHRIVGREVLGALGPNGYLINVARGALVDEDALAEALAAGRLRGAALDVFVNEPEISPLLLACPNTVFSPHIGSATVAAREAMAAEMLANVRAFLEGRPLLTPVI
jgi:lactate dehydrogenase-like 2-hydroxyacid dehydrogenase